MIIKTCKHWEGMKQDPYNLQYCTKHKTDLVKLCSCNGDPDACTFGHELKADEIIVVEFREGRR